MKVVKEHFLNDSEDGEVKQDAGQGREEGREVCPPHHHGAAAALHEGHAEHQLIDVHYRQALHEKGGGIW